MTTPKKVAALAFSLSLFAGYLFLQTRSAAKPTADAGATSQPATRPATGPALNARLIYGSKSAAVVDPNRLPATSATIVQDPKMLISTSKSLVLIDPKDRPLLSGSKSAVLITPPPTTPPAVAAEPPQILLAGSKSKVLIAPKPTTQPTTRPHGK